MISEFYCTQCGTKGIPIIRKSGKEREAGHLKKLWCLKCKQENNHVECKPGTKYDYSDFCTEYEYGNFDENGLRIRTYGELRSLIYAGKIEKQKTLDSVRDSRSGKEHLDSES